jgi:hypothetical protein
MRSNKLSERASAEPVSASKSRAGTRRQLAAGALLFAALAGTGSGYHWPDQATHDAPRFA